MAEDLPFHLAHQAAYFDVPRQMHWVARRLGVSRGRQLAQMAALAVGPGRLKPDDYIRYALFRPGLTGAERRAFLSIPASAALNQRLVLPGQGMAAITVDKLATAGRLTAAGLPCTPSHAVFSPGPAPTGLRHLPDAAALARYLAHEAPLPLFGKPLKGTFGIGTVAITARDGGTAQGDVGLVLADGRVFGATAFATAVARHFPDGWLIQPRLSMHPAMAAFCGDALGTLRVVTLWADAAPEILYVMQKFPGHARAISDNSSFVHPNAMALIDPATGRAVRGQLNSESNYSALLASPATGAPLADLRVPMLDRALELALDSHRQFRGQAILGLDILITPEGPIVGEVNASPVHTLYQRPADRGLMNPDFAPRFRAALARCRASR